MQIFYYTILNRVFLSMTLTKTNCLPYMRIGLNEKTSNLRNIEVISIRWRHTKTQTGLLGIIIYN